MPFLANHQTFNCLTSYVVETIGDDNVQAIRPFFDRLPVDPYFEEGFRFRRFSHFSIKSIFMLTFSQYSSFKITTNPEPFS